MNHGEYFTGTIPDCVDRAQPRIVRDYGTASPISRSQDRSCLPRLVCVQGDSKATEWRIAVEYPSWMLRGAGGQFCSRRTRAFLEDMMHDDDEATGVGGFSPHCLVYAPEP